MSDSSGSSLSPVVLQAQRERTITALCDHFANDRLTVEEFERRLDVANRTSAAPDLEQLLSDLPALTTATQPAAAPTAAPTPLPPLAKHGRAEQTLVALMGGVERRGHWQPAQKTLVIAVMGGGMLDFREAQLPPGETEVTVLAVMGGCEIIVPPGMAVDCNGVAIMGGFAHAGDTPRSQHTGPLLRVNGFALMGGVDVQVREIGESGKDASRRMREERRRLRDERRR